MIAYLIFVILIVYYHIFFLINRRKRFKIRQSRLGSGIADNEMVAVRYKGQLLPMRFIEKIEVWDNLTREEKREASIKIRKSIDKGRLSKSSVTPTSDIKIFEE